MCVIRMWEGTNEGCVDVCELELQMCEGTNEGCVRGV